MIALKFAITVSYSVDVSSDVDINLFVADVNMNAFAVVTALKFPM